MANTHTHTHPQFQNVVSPHQTKNSQAGRACLRIKTRIMRRDVLVGILRRERGKTNQMNQIFIISFDLIAKGMKSSHLFNAL